jgi:hypothetical protein
MGMYTLFYCNVALKPETPSEMIDALKVLAQIDDSRMEKIKAFKWPDHEFFSCERFTMLFTCSSAYFSDNEQGVCSLRQETKNPCDYWGNDNVWVLKVKNSLKNYDGEIQKFVDWIKPWLYEGVIFSEYEEFKWPTLEWGK